MHLAAHDQGYVEAGPGAVYGTLSDLATYPAWWPDARWGGGLLLRLGGRRPSRAAADRHRRDLGLFLRLSGSAPGTLEWHLEPYEDGTIVNGILELDLRGGRRRSARALLRARGRLRRGLVGLKRRLEAP